MSPGGITAFTESRSLVFRYGWNTLSYQILNPGISLWFSASGRAVTGYFESPTHIIVAGVPVAAETELAMVAREFIAFAASRGKSVCFFGAQERFADLIAEDSPFSSILLGAQPVWLPDNLKRQFSQKPSLRAQIARARKKNVRIEITRPGAEACIPELRRCLGEWLQSRGLPSLHFLVEPNTLDNLGDRIVAIARIGNRVVGYSVATPVPVRNGWLIEQSIRGNGAPNGTIEFLLSAMTEHISAIGGSFITLGLSPLSGHYQPVSRQPRWLSFILKTMKISGRAFYNFSGLDAFKAKFQPDSWEPVYAITNEAKPSLRTLHAIATAFCGSSPLGFLLKGIWRKLF